MHALRQSLLVPAVIAIAAVALAGSFDPPQVIYSSIASSPTSDVPGVPGAKFQSFSRPYRSDNSRYWILRADTDLPTAEDGVLLKGSGLVGSVVVREGAASHWSTPGQTVESFKEQLGINDSGHYAFGVNMGGTAPTTADEMVVRWAGSFSLIAQESGPVPGVAGEFYGTTLDSVSLTNAGQVAFRAPLTTGGQPDATDEFLIFDNAVLAQEGVTIPTGVFGGPQAWDNFDLDDFSVSSSGAVWIAQGDVLGDTTRDKVVVRNGGVVMQEGRTVTGLPAPFDAILAAEIALAPEGSWMARGETTNDLEDFVLHNGQVVATTGSSVPFGFPFENFSEALFDATFFSIASNGYGDFLYGGVTDYVDPNHNAVLVWSDEMLFLREGDGVDVDGDGLANDGAVISVFNNDDVFVGDDGWVYFTADLYATAGTPLGQAFLRVLAPICRGDMNCDGIVDFFDIDPFVFALGFPGGVNYPANCYWLAADCDEDGDVDFFDIDPFVARIGQPCIPIP